jgi:serine/threonine protein kinase
MSEVDTHKTLDHPNIVKLIEIIEDETCYHLVMELCTG